MPYFNIVAETNENTVVTEYTPLPKTATGYQSEADLEREFIQHLQEQGNCGIWPSIPQRMLSGI